MVKTETIEILNDFDDNKLNEKHAREFVSKISTAFKLPKSIAVDFEGLMMKLFETTKVIAGEIINVGRIIFVKLFEFIEANPKMALGTIIGAVFGSFLNMVPLIGSILSLVATFLGAAIGAYLDSVDKGSKEASNILEKTIAGATDATKEFFKLLKEIFNVLKIDKSMSDTKTDKTIKKPFNPLANPFL